MPQVFLKKWSLAVSTLVSGEAFHVSCGPQLVIDEDLRHLLKRSTNDSLSREIEHFIFMKFAACLYTGCVCLFACVRVFACVCVCVLEYVVVCVYVCQCV